MLDPLLVPFVDKLKRPDSDAVMIEDALAYRRGFNTKDVPPVYDATPTLSAICLPPTFSFSSNRYINTSCLVGSVTCTKAARCERELDRMPKLSRTNVW